MNSSSPSRSPPRPPPPAHKNAQKASNRRSSDSAVPQGPSYAPKGRRGPGAERRGSWQDQRHAGSGRQAAQQDAELKIVLIVNTRKREELHRKCYSCPTYATLQVSTGILSATEHTQLAEFHMFHGTIKLKVQVVDFPDVTCDMTDEAVRKEVQLCTTLTFPYSSAICLVVRADVRFTPEEYATYRKTRELLGERMFDNMVVLFTMGDKLPAADRTTFRNSFSGPTRN
ncbi:hypothetical protein V1264_024739 [Littorina saxatilis]|uniref:AIG1-type G domain-containing protein n=1 Tax=Littorina saxatilis TaxID=31220 RepID=A0AAN9ALB7_9CAEN